MLRKAQHDNAANATHYCHPEQYRCHPELACRELVERSKGETKLVAAEGAGRWDDFAAQNVLHGNRRIGYGLRQA
ncbi:MAG: hypothetical protein NVSMB31_10990 [Vulcanimicrobiaceae bacterium]